MHALAQRRHRIVRAIWIVGLGAFAVLGVLVWAGAELPTWSIFAFLALVVLLSVTQDLALYYKSPKEP